MLKGYSTIPVAPTLFRVVQWMGQGRVDRHRPAADGVWRMRDIIPIGWFEGDAGANNLFYLTQLLGQRDGQEYDHEETALWVHTD